MVIRNDSWLFYSFQRLIIKVIWLISIRMVQIYMKLNCQGNFFAFNVLLFFLITIDSVYNITQEYQLTFIFQVATTFVLVRRVPFYLSYYNQWLFCSLIINKTNLLFNNNNNNNKNIKVRNLGKKKKGLQVTQGEKMTLLGLKTERGPFSDTAQLAQWFSLLTLWSLRARSESIEKWKEGKTQNPNINYTMLSHSASRWVINFSLFLSRFFIFHFYFMVLQ